MKKKTQQRRSTRKPKTTLKQVVEAATAAGAQVSVSLKPKEVDLEPLRQMTLDLDAIYHLAKSRNYESIKAAGMLARRISYNEILFTLMALEKEYLEKPIMERP